jgi:hypothetical protein
MGLRGGVDQEPADEVDEMEAGKLFPPRIVRGELPPSLGVAAILRRTKCVM